MIGLSASAALRKNCFTAASLYFCCVSTRDQHVGRLADGVGPLPVDRHVGIDVRAHRPAPTAAAPLRPGRQKMRSVACVVERVVRRLPAAQHKMLEEPRQAARIVEAGRHEADGMLGAGGQRRDGAGGLACQVVEDDRFADIRAADDGHDQQRRTFELRQQLAAQQIEPFAFARRCDTQALSRRTSPAIAQCSIEGCAGECGEIHGRSDREQLPTQASGLNVERGAAYQPCGRTPPSTRATVQSRRPVPRSATRLIVRVMKNIVRPLGVVVGYRIRRLNQVAAFHALFAGRLVKADLVAGSQGEELRTTGSLRKFLSSPL